MQTVKQVILCVDDEPANLRLLERTLGSSGYLVILAHDGREALELIDSRPVDLVLTDVLMPGMDGLETCRRIKGDERYRHIPVVMITALGSKADRIRGIEAGADEFLAKPYDHAEVLARVKMLLKTRQLDALLDDSYNNILNLTSFGSQMMTSFRASAFELMSQIDRLSDQVIRKEAAVAGRPSTVLVCIADGLGFGWHRYTYASGRLERSVVEVGSRPSIAAAGGVGASFCNHPATDQRFGPLAARFTTLGIAGENMACYLSDLVSVFALDYGREVTRFDAAVLESLAVQTLFFMHMAMQIKENDEAFAYTVQSLARAAEASDQDTGDHILRVGEYCAILGRQLGMAEDFVASLRLQAVLHDVGKLHVPTEILKKPGSLTPGEWEIMKRHAVKGAEIIGDHPKFVMARQIALSHHERWDGSGYPAGLAGEQIPLVGRIVNIADQYDALRNARSYKLPFDHATTVGIITKGDGRTMPGHFDPRVLQAFVESASEFARVYAGATAAGEPGGGNKTWHS